MKKIFLILFIFPVICAMGQGADSAYIRSHYKKIETYIPMRDGVRLFTAIYFPIDKTQAYPFLITRTPFSVDPYGEDRYRTSLGPSILFAREGYIFVYQDVRGKWMSEGVFEDVRPLVHQKKNKKQTDESTDAFDTIEWLIKNIPGNNGKAGMHGTSYNGFYASAALPGAHPALRAVSPQAPVTDWFAGDDFHHNGAFMFMDAFNFYSSFGVPRPNPITRDRGPKPFRYPVNSNYKFFLDIGPLKNVSALYFADTIKFWNDLMAHGSYDAFWKARDIRPHLSSIKPATMVVGGFFDADDCFGPLRTYETLEKQNNGNENILIMGPWFHGSWAYEDGEALGNIRLGQPTGKWFRENIEFPFFQKHLKGVTGITLPEAAIFETGSNRWRTFDQWPPADAVTKDLFLREKGGLSFSPPDVPESYDEYVSDPDKPVPYAEGVHIRRTRDYLVKDQRFAAQRPDVMVYQSAVLNEDLILAGPVIADLIVSTTGSDADFVVKLIDVFPEELTGETGQDNARLAGYQFMVRGDVIRGKFRNSLEKPEPFASGVPSNVRFQLNDVSHAFKKGHRIMVQIQSSWFPLVDRNPQKFMDIYHAEKEDFRKAIHRIYHDSLHTSLLQLTVLNSQ